MIWVRIACAVLALASAFGFGLWVLNSNDRHYAARVRQLREQTPDHDHRGGPTQYDHSGRVRP